MRLEIPYSWTFSRFFFDHESQIGSFGEFAFDDEIGDLDFGILGKIFEFFILGELGSPFLQIVKFELVVDESFFALTDVLNLHCLK